MNLCEHNNHRVDAKIAKLTDSGATIAEIRITCAECGEPYRFVGIDAGLSFDGPRVSIDGLELNAPIEPEGHKRLASRATYEMPRRNPEDGYAVG